MTFVVCAADTGVVVRGPFDTQDEAEEAAHERSRNIASGHTIKELVDV